MKNLRALLLTILLTSHLLIIGARSARADALNEWNVRACELVGIANFDTPTANRALAMMHTAVYEAVNAITKKYPFVSIKIEADPNASIDAAVAAASRTALLELVPTKSADIESIYRTSLATIADGKSKTDGIRVGEAAAALVLAARSNDGFPTTEAYRPYTVAGVYVPTALPLVSGWSQRKPWLMTSVSQFRPGPPPDLKSELWARDYNEIKAIGEKHSTVRTAEQTNIAKFWEATLPSIYHGLVRSVTAVPGREITQNARLYMAVTQAADDALIAVFDAKYHYNFWRPITAIRNGDIDGNDATERDPSWTPFINTPMHPEYPCAHCIVAGAIGTVLEAEIGSAKAPVLATTSNTANNVKRTWMKIDDFIQEVANGRICDGVHYRNSAEVGTAMGRQIGKLAAAKYLMAK
jgi:hypothetical protein